MKLSLKLAAVTIAAAATALVGASVTPGVAAAADPAQPTQPADGGIVVTNTESTINVLIVNRKKASECTVTASRPAGADAVKTFTKKVTLNAANQNTANATFSGLGPFTYSLSGTCVEPNAAEPTKPGSSNLLGGANKFDVKLKGGVSTPTNQCLLIVKGIAWDLGLRGAPLEAVMGIAAQFCPR
ncbi:hypothetical protein [Gordonia malaquae]|uniref:Secreted protein n=1 Tax=Gordonia malaquae NBRC 108250 TaxID=1223542 RepID=M3TJT4_GORML|nr:hypothetical protein [Gordonia malaquae]GAC81741.1 hypothetical protein GM1_043_00140 [Gordonia malaquae NBRC 108250]SEB72365.1 hypothetical protein SAMN04488550_0683 [Gordonia malaquae]